MNTKGSEWEVLPNQLANRTADIKQLIVTTQDRPKPSKMKPVIGLAKTNMTKEGNNNSKMCKLQWGPMSPTKGSATIIPCDIINPCATDIVNSTEESTREQSVDTPEEGWKSVWLLDKVAGDSAVHPGIEQPDIAKIFKPTILMRKMDPNNLERVRTILLEVTIGEDLDLSQQTQVEELISEYAVCFALSMSEVTPMEGATHHLDILRDQQFPNQNQSKTTEPTSERALQQSDRQDANGRHHMANRSPRHEVLLSYYVSKKGT